jgi:hypothetical protein
MFPLARCSRQERFVFSIPKVHVSTVAEREQSPGLIRHGIIKGRQLCRGAPWVIKAEDLAAYREQKASRHSLTSNPAQQSFQFQ